MPLTTCSSYGEPTHGFVARRWLSNILTTARTVSVPYQFRFITRGFEWYARMLFFSQKPNAKQRTSHSKYLVMQLTEFKRPKSHHTTRRH